MKKTIHLLHCDLGRLQSSRAESEIKVKEPGLDWRESAKEKPDMARIFLTIDQHGHVFRWNPESRGPLCWEVFTHWAYFNPPADPAEDAWKLAPTFSDDAEPKHIWLAGWRAAKESK